MPTFKLGDPVEVALPPPGLPLRLRGVGLGAEIRVPITGDVVVGFEPAVLSKQNAYDSCGEFYTKVLATVTLPSPAAEGAYLIVFRTDDEPPSIEQVAPLFVGDAETVSALGSDVVATLPAIEPPPPRMGARIEVPITRAIASAWRPAVLDETGWTATVESPAAKGEYLLVWMDDSGGNEQFIPLFITET
jgi:hypothetical protein